MFSNFTNLILTSVLFILFQLIHANVYGQESDEIWPEVDGIYRINDQFRVMGTLSATRKESENTDGSAAIYLDYFALPFFRKMETDIDSAKGYYQWFRVGYSYSHSVASPEDEFKENVIMLESNTRFHLPLIFLATFKNRLDTRFYNGSLIERYRPRITLERDFKTEFLTFTMYTYGEYYFNFNSTSSNKMRLCLGAEIWVTKVVSFEVYYLHQFQKESRGNDFNATGLVLKFNLESKHEKALRKVEKEEVIRAK